MYLKLLLGVFLAIGTHAASRQDPDAMQMEVDAAPAPRPHQRPPQPANAYLAHLPSEIKQMIIGFLSPVDVTRVAQTCVALQKATKGMIDPSCLNRFQMQRLLEAHHLKGTLPPICAKPTVLKISQLAPEDSCIKALAKLMDVSLKRELPLSEYLGPFLSEGTQELYIDKTRINPGNQAGDTKKFGLLLSEHPSISTISLTDAGEEDQGFLEILRIIGRQNIDTLIIKDNRVTGGMLKDLVDLPFFPGLKKFTIGAEIHFESDKLTEFATHLADRKHGLTELGVHSVLLDTHNRTTTSFLTSAFRFPHLRLLELFHCQLVLEELISVLTTSKTLTGHSLPPTLEELELTGAHIYAAQVGWLMVTEYEEWGSVEEKREVLDNFTRMLSLISGPNLQKLIIKDNHLGPVMPAVITALRETCANCPRLHTVDLRHNLPRDGTDTEIGPIISDEEMRRLVIDNLPSTVRVLWE